GETIGGGAVAGREFGKHLPDGVFLQELCYGGSVGLELIVEIGAERAGEVFQAAGARLQQVNGAQDPFAIALRGGQTRVAPLVFYQWKQFFRGMSADVLGVEPVELGAIEDGVGARDAVEREERDE